MNTRSKENLDKTPTKPAKGKGKGAVPVSTQSPPSKLAGKSPTKYPTPQTAPKKAARNERGSEKDTQQMAQTQEDLNQLYAMLMEQYKPKLIMVPKKLLKLNSMQALYLLSWI